jgi:hypothetical protein
MSKKAGTTASTCRDPENRSDKLCVCGGHSAKHQRAKPRRKRPDFSPVRKMKDAVLEDAEREMIGDDADYLEDVGCK